MNKSTSASDNKHDFINIGVVSKCSNDNELMRNPLFVGVNDDELKRHSYRDIKQNYDVYILCKKDSSTLDTNEKINLFMRIYDEYISTDDFKSICRMITLVPTDVSILRNKSFKEYAFIVDKNILVTYFENTCVNYDNDAIVVSMYDITSIQAMRYSRLYSLPDMSELEDIVNMIYVYNGNNIYNIYNQLFAQIYRFRDSYWCERNNCNFSFDRLFCNRNIKLRSDNKTVNVKNKIYIGDADDNNEINRFGEKINISFVIRNIKPRTFFVDDDDINSNRGKRQIAYIFDTLPDEKLKYDLITNLLISKKYCHLVVSNKNILISARDMIRKYKPLFAYLFGYAFITLYIEECMIYTRTTENSRCVFNLDDVAHLPHFPFSAENIHHSPYVPIFVDKSKLQLANMASCGLCPFEDSKEQYYGTCNAEIATERMNGFITSKRNEKTKTYVNIFDGLPKGKYSVSGSVMEYACQRGNPLIDYNGNDTMSDEQKRENYYNHMYKDSDVDVICDAKTIVMFIDHVYVFIDNMCRQLDCKKDDINIVPDKKVALIFTTYLTECLDNMNEETMNDYTHEYIELLFNNLCENKTHNIPVDISNYLYNIYSQKKIVDNERFNTSENNNDLTYQKLSSKFKELTSIDNMVIKKTNYNKTKITYTSIYENEIPFFINDFRDADSKVPENENHMVMKFSESIRYKVKCPELKKPIEIFRMNSTESYKNVVMFHLNCVRIYYRDGQIRLYTSAVGGKLANINYDIRYRATSRNFIDIIEKNIKRGYTTILNPVENKSFISCNMGNEKDNGRFKIDSKYSGIGPKKITDKVFRYDPNKPNEKKDNLNYLTSVSDLKEVYREYIDKLPFDILSYTAIGNNGSVTPVAKWVIDAVYYYYNN